MRSLKSAMKSGIQFVLLVTAGPVIGILASLALSPSVAAAHLPISCPATKLSVAKVMS